MSLKMYQLDSVLNFGKYNGLIMHDVIAIQPTYIDWCILNLDHFLIDSETLDFLNSLASECKLSTKGLEKLKEKFAIWECENIIEEENDDEQDYYASRSRKDYDSDTFYALTDGSCGYFEDWCDKGGDFDSLMDGF